MTGTALDRTLIDPFPTPAPIGAGQDATQVPVTRSPVTTVRLPTAWGELARGAVDGAEFLFNCPIDRYVEATVTDSARAGLRIDCRGDARRIESVLMRVARNHALQARQRIRIDEPTQSPRIASGGTACLVAALDAFSRHHAIGLDPKAAGELVAATAPPDGLHHPGIAEIDPMTGRLLASWPAPRGLRLLALEATDRDQSRIELARLRAVHIEHRDEIRQFLSQLRCGLMTNDGSAIGAAATRSARLGQGLAPWRPFDTLLRIAAEAGAQGLCSAAGGRRFGVIHVDSPQLTERLARAIERDLGDAVVVRGDHRIIGGGSQVR
jgi:uncharacterized protein involved in propanediol utilization